MIAKQERVPTIKSVDVFVSLIESHRVPEPIPDMNRERRSFIRHNFVVSLDNRFLHFLQGLKWAISEFKDSRVADMLVTGYKNVRHSSKPPSN